jgi:hypothetical protein
MLFASSNMLVASNQIGSNPLGVLIVAAVLIGASRPLIRWVAGKEHNPWLVRILTISLVLHLLAAPAQIYVVENFYHGIADWIRYDTQGAILAPHFRSLNFTLAGSNVRGIVNDGSVSIFAGVVMAIVGVNQLATFMVFGWFSFLGSILFYRAFTITFPGVWAGHRRYAYLVFFLPSTIFWTADVSKEAIMTISLGLIAYGCAKVLVRAPGGFRIATLGVVVGVLIRPNELLVILGAFAVALMIRSQGGRGARSTLKRIGGLLFMAVLLGASIFTTLHYLKLGGTGTAALTSANSNNNGTGTGFGSSGFVYSTSPARWPIDAYEVLFNPLPFNAHGSGEYAAALENTVIVGVMLASYGQLRILGRTAFARPYVMMCLIYGIGFIYAFASLGNLGLIYRERVMLLPFLMVLFAIPRTPKGRIPMYEWEYKRKERKGFRAAMAQRERMFRSMKMAYANSLLKRTDVTSEPVAVTAGAEAPPLSDVVDVPDAGPSGSPPTVP